MGRRRKHRHLTDDQDAINAACVAQIQREKDSKVTDTSHSVSTQSTLPMVRKSCYHDGEDAAFTLWDRKFSFAGAAGGKICLDYAPREDTVLIVDLGGAVSLKLRAPSFAGPWYKSGPQAFKDIDPVPPPPPSNPDIPILRFDHPDRQEPKVPIDYWYKFNDVLHTEYPKGGHIIVACIGGHGRTGTVLASIILAACPEQSVASVIEFIRAEHCENAIESASQVEYLLKFRPKEIPTDWMRDEMEPPKKWTGGYVHGQPLAGVAHVAQNPVAHKSPDIVQGIIRTGH